MFIAHFENTMRNARPRAFVQPEIVRSIEQIRIEKRAAALEAQRQKAAAWSSLLDEMKEKAALAAQAPLLYRTIQIRDVRTPVRSLIERVAAFHGLSYEVIVGPRRDRASVAARFDAIKAVHDARPDLTTPQIGKHFNRDHTSILHALGRLNKTKDKYLRINRNRL